MIEKTQKMVPGAGLEPARCCHRGILSPLRLPISPPGLWRRWSESNRRWRSCSPLHYHFATAPQRCGLLKPAPNR